MVFKCLFLLIEKSIKTNIYAIYAHIIETQ